MKLLLVGSGSGYSTSDVERGFHQALVADGHDVGLYALTQRTALARGYLDYQWRHVGRPEAKPGPADVMYLASEELCTRAWANEADWVLVVAGRKLHLDALRALHYSGMPTALIGTEMPYDDAEFHSYIAPLFTVVFSNERSSVAALRPYNENTFYLPPAYDPAKHHPTAGGADESQIPAHDVLFVGSDFPERMRTLAAVDWTGIDLALYGQWPYGRRSPRLRPYVRGGVIENVSTAALYRKAKVGLNLYRTLQGFDRKADRHISGAESLNPRALELAACGLFHISDWRAEVEEVFGDAVPVYHTPEQLGRLVRHYLAHPDERAENAARLPACVTGHTYTERAREMIEVLRNV